MSDLVNVIDCEHTHTRTNAHTTGAPSRYGELRHVLAFQRDVTEFRRSTHRLPSDFYSASATQTTRALYVY